MRKFIIIMVSVLLVVLSACSSGPGQYDGLAQCLTEKGAAMYGTEWCLHCKNQKEAFGKSFQYIDFIDCDRAKEVCSVEGIKLYPTWKINGKDYTGEITLQRLAELTGCEI